MKNIWSFLGGSDYLSLGILSQIMLQWILPGVHIFSFLILVDYNSDKSIIRSYFPSL